MMVTLCTGSHFGQQLADQRVAGLVVGGVATLSSGMTMDLRSGPMMILSLALSKSLHLDQARALRRAAIRRPR